MVREADAAAMMEAAADAVPPYPGGFEGRGVVICGGGARYFPCAWVCVSMLRELGCLLPIELWHLGPAELDGEMRGLIESFEVTCVDAARLREAHPARILNGFELKPYAILHSRFREVLLLDADNFPLVDPAFLFDTPQFREHGAIFWPDYGRLSPQREIWRLTGVAYRDEPEFESGQVVVDKQRCWRELSLTMWMNEHSDFWYRYIHGDKETFHLAWRKLGREYAMPRYPIQRLQSVMCQHDFEGRRIFQHRNLAKWSLHGPNRRIPGFLREDDGLRMLDELREKWMGYPLRPYRDDAAGEPERRMARELCTQRWLYRRIGHDERPMRFGLDGTVTEGSAGCERTWCVRQEATRYQLWLLGGDAVTCRLEPLGSSRWSGRWEVHERMPVELVPYRTGHGGLRLTVI